jgi:predicted transcriptional regulator
MELFRVASLPGDYPMITPAYAEKRRSIAKSIGLGRKPAVEASATKMRSAHGYPGSQ